MNPPSSGAADSPNLSKVGEVFGNLAFELRAGLERTKRLVERFDADRLDEAGRLEAREGARYLAVEGRIGFMRLEEILESVPGLFPGYAAALRVATRLAYCLLALSGDDPEPLALIARHKLDSIVRDNGAEEWFQTILSQLPEGMDR